MRHGVFPFHTDAGGTQTGLAGADAVLVNTAIAVAEDPVNMAVAFKMAVEAGRMAFEAQLAPQNLSASATSPLNPFLEGIKDLQL